MVGIEDFDKAINEFWINELQVNKKKRPKPIGNIVEKSLCEGRIPREAEVNVVFYVVGVR